MLIIPILFSIFYSQFTSFLRLAKTQMYSPLCHISIFWGFFCRHTTKSFRINQPASSTLKAQPQISTHRETQGSFLNFTITPECIWRKWNVFPTARDQDFFLIVLEIFRLEETTSVKQKAINTLNEQTLAPEAHLLTVSPGEFPLWMRRGINQRASTLSNPWREDRIIGLSPVY